MATDSSGCRSCSLSRADRHAGIDVGPSTWAAIAKCTGRCWSMSEKKCSSPPSGLAKSTEYGWCTVVVISKYCLFIRLLELCRAACPNRAVQWQDHKLFSEKENEKPAKRLYQARAMDCCTEDVRRLRYAALSGSEHRRS